VDVTKDNAVVRCQRSGDNDVMGIVSDKPSVIGNGKDNRENDNNYKTIGMIGQISGLVSTENGNIQIGDSLTSATLSGYMRKANAGESTVGIAMQNFDGTKGTIKILISRRNQSLTVEKVEETVTENIANMNLKDNVDNLISQAETNLNNQIDALSSTFTDSQRNLIDTQLAAKTDPIQIMQTKLQEQMDMLVEQSKVTADFIATLDVTNLIYKDKLGNLDLGEGKLTAANIEVSNEVKAKQVKTDTLEMTDNKTSGKSFIPAGESKIVIETPEASNEAKIYITATGSNFGKTLYVSEEDTVEGISFEVKFDGDPAGKDIKFNWLIIK
jgi:hypothetical protein